MKYEMITEVKIGRREDFISSYNLFFPSGLRLKTIDLTFATSEDRAKIAKQFEDLVENLRLSGWEVNGEVF